MQYFTSCVHVQPKRDELNSLVSSTTNLLHPICENELRDHSDDDEDPPPPPPLPPLPLRSQSSSCSRCTSSIVTKSTSSSSSSSSSSSKTISITKRRRRDRNIEVAKQFHTFVIQMKCLYGWKDYVVLRKHAIQSKKNILKRILLKWTTYVQEIQSKRESTVVLVRLLEVARLNTLIYGLEKLHDYAKDVDLVERMFEGWKEFGIFQKELRMERQRNLTYTLSIQTLGFCFNGWRGQVNVTKVAKRTKEILLTRILRGWNEKAKSLSYARAMSIKQAMLLISESKHDLIKKVFGVLRLYSVKKKKHRRSLHKRANTLTKEALHSWRKFCNDRYQLRMKMKRILMRWILKQWRGTIEHRKLKDRVHMQIILNRWKTLVEEKQERRSKLTLAKDHCKDRTRQRVMSCWLKLANERRGRLRTPPDSSVAKMKFMRDNVWGVKECYHSQPIELEIQRPWNSMPRPFNPNRGFIGTSYRGNESMLQSSVLGSSLEDSMRRNEFCTNHISTESLFAPNTMHDRRRLSLFDSTCRSVSPVRRDNSMFNHILGASDGGSSHFRRRPIMDPTEALGKDVPSWILRDLSERRSNEMYSKHRRMNYVPQDSIDSVPEAEPKFQNRNSSQCKYTLNRPSAAFAKNSYIADMAQMKPNPRSYNHKRNYDSKDSKCHQQYKNYKC